MIQLAFDNNWAYRYYSGVNVTNWEGIQLEADIPADWMVYTKDLTKDFAWRLESHWCSVYTLGRQWRIL